MSDTLNEQLEKLKERLVKWNGQLTGFKQWALANDGILDETEKSLIALLEKEINAINQRILQVEKAIYDNLLN